MLESYPQREAHRPRQTGRTTDLTARLASDTCVRIAEVRVI